MSYNTIVIAREIWDTRDLIGNVLNDDGTLKESGLSTRFEPEDLNALEIALKIKDEHGGTVTVLSLGESKNVDVLRESLFRGVDKVIRLTDSNANKLDSLAQSLIFQEAIKKIGDYSLILTGVNVSEGENSLLGVDIANQLNIEHVSYIDNLEEIKSDQVTCNRAVEMGYEVLSVKLPACISVGIALVKDDPRTPRSAKAALKLKMKKVAIDQWGAADLGIPDTASQVATIKNQYEAIEQRIVRAKKVDPESDSELQEMIKDIL